jgi:hypothetical protein
MTKELVCPRSKQGLSLSCNLTGNVSCASPAMVNTTLAVVPAPWRLPVAVVIR